MAAVSASSHLTGLARALVAKGLLTEREVDTVLSRTANQSDGFVPELLRSTKLKSLQLAEFAAQAFNYPLLDLNALDPESTPKSVLDSKLMQKRRIAALFQRGNKLFVGVSDPTNLLALDEVKFQTGLAIEPVVVEDDKLAKWIDKVESSMDSTRDVLNAEELNLEFTDEDTTTQQDTGGIEIDDAPVVRYLQKIMLDAINTGASDIHLEPYEKFYRIRYRRDGILYEIAQPPLAIKEKIASRIKVISKLDISEKRVPQDGRVKMVLSKNRAIDFRVSTLPTLFGEKIVMRI